MGLSIIWCWLKDWTTRTKGRKKKIQTRSNSSEDIKEGLRGIWTNLEPQEDQEEAVANIRGVSCDGYPIDSGIDAPNHLFECLFVSFVIECVIQCHTV